MLVVQHLMGHLLLLTHSYIPAVQSLSSSPHRCQVTSPAEATSLHVIVLQKLPSVSLWSRFLCLLRNYFNCIFFTQCAWMCFLATGCLRHRETNGKTFRHHLSVLCIYIQCYLNTYFQTKHVLLNSSLQAGLNICVSVWGLRDVLYKHV